MKIHTDYSNCGVNHISGLAAYNGRSGEEMMANLCASVSKSSSFGGGGGITFNCAILLFNGALGKRGRYNGKSDYCTTFAKFIKDNKLGKVSKMPSTPNILYSDRHKIAVWGWVPDVPALKEWWRNYKTGKPKEPGA